MARRPVGLHILSDVAYHDYLAVLLLVDAEWSRRKVDAQAWERLEPFQKLHGPIAWHCQKYSRDIDLNFRRFSRANESGHAGRRSSPRPHAGTAVARYLYNPVCYYPLGHADGMNLILLDDFDPLHYLVGEIQSTLEEACLAFCPKLESLGVKKGEFPFCSLDGLLGEAASLPAWKPNGASTCRAVRHAFQQEMPLVVFTKYKMEGLASVGQGLLCQQALLRAMVGKIRETVGFLRQNLDRPEVATWLGEEDLQATRCAFLDLQGPEEIGTLIFCSNYSVAMTLVGAIRTITFGDILDADPEKRVGRALAGSMVHRVVVSEGLRLGKPPGRQGQAYSVRQLRKNHAFCWTYSALAVSPWSLMGRGRSKCRGKVEASIRYQIAPGHRLPAEEKIGKTCGRAGVAVDSVDYHRFHIATADLVVPTDGDDRIRHGEPVLLRRLLEVIWRNYRELGRKPKGGNPGTNVVDFEADLCIPVPHWGSRRRGDCEDPVGRRIGQKHRSMLTEVLLQVRESLSCGENWRELRGRNRGVSTIPSRLDLGELRRRYRRLGIPVALRRTIEYLYQNFTTILVDPFLFDLVLDLYDTFATLHAVLAEHLPRVCADKLRAGDGAEPGGLGRERVGQLAGLVEALRNAMMHRISKAYPEAPVRDVAIDFRGGLNQVLLAADVPMKCGLGLLRDHTRRPRGSTDSLPVIPARDTVGAVTCVSFIPGAKCHSLNFGVEGDARLAYFEVDVPHVLHIPSYGDYLHEAFHLIFDALLRKTGGPLSGIRGSLMVERLSEIFALVLCRALVFACSPDAFRLHQAYSYSKSLISRGADDRQKAARLAEFLVRLFVASDAFPAGNAARDDWSEKPWRHVGEKPEKALARFQRMIKTAGPFFTAYAGLSDSKRRAVDEYLERVFLDVYPRVCVIMPDLWCEAMAVYRDYADTAIGHDDRRVTKQVKKAFQQGRAVIRSLYPDPRRRQSKIGSRSEPLEDYGLDPLILVCRTLEVYLSRIRQARGKEMRLFRSGNTGDVDFTPRGRPWNNFLIEQGSAAMFCPVPADRRARLRRQIAALKTFWDMSSNLRGRRLHDIVCATCV